jgi:hypothetical protein
VKNFTKSAFSKKYSGVLSEENAGRTGEFAEKFELRISRKPSSAADSCRRWLDIALASCEHSKDVAFFSCLLERPGIVASCARPCCGEIEGAGLICGWKAECGFHHCR